MNLRFVEAFYWVATLGSVTLAASRLSLTQSAVSSRLSALESELGKPLLDRRTQPLKPTAIGERFLIQASRFLELQREVRELFAAPQTVPATLRIGANESVLHSWLMPFVEALGTAEPQLKLELSIDTTPALHEFVKRGSVDICFGTGALESEGVRNLSLPAIELVFVEAAPAGDGAGGRPPAARATRSARVGTSAAALASATIITFQRGSQPTRSLLAQLQEPDPGPAAAGRGPVIPVRPATRTPNAMAHGAKGTPSVPARVLFTPSISAMLELIRRRFGAATLPRNVVAAGLSRGELRLVDFGITLQPLPVVASWRPDPATGLPDRVAMLAQAHAHAAMDSGRAAPGKAHSKPRSRVTRKS